MRSTLPITMLFVAVLFFAGCVASPYLTCTDTAVDRAWCETGVGWEAPDQNPEFVAESE